MITTQHNKVRLLQPKQFSAKPLSRIPAIRYYALGIALYATIFTIWQPEQIPWHIHLTGVVFVALCAYPIVRWSRQQTRQAPMFELLCLAYGLQYGTPLHIQNNQIWLLSSRVTLAWEDTFRTLCLATLGVAIMMFTYYRVSNSQLAKTVPKLDLVLAPQKRGLYIFFALTCGILFIFMRTTGSSILSSSRIGAIISLLANQAYIALGILSYFLFTGKLSRFAWKWVLYLSLFIMVMLGMSTGMLENTFIPFVLIFCVRWQVAGKLPWRLLLLAVLLFLLFQPIKQSFRSEAWVGGSATAVSVNTRLLVWANLIEESVMGVFEPNSTTNSFLDANQIRTSMARFDLLHTSVYVQSVTPNRIPYYEGKSYAYLLVGWIPRILWPNKPIAQEANNIFALDYGFITSAQVGKTMTGIGHIAEAFANFGILGVCLVMSLQGCFFALINQILNSSTSEGGSAIYLSIMVFFLNGLGSATAAFFASIIQYILAQAVIIRCFTNSFSVTRSSRTNSTAHFSRLSRRPLVKRIT